MNKYVNVVLKIDIHMNQFEDMNLKQQYCHYVNQSLVALILIEEKEDLQVFDENMYVHGQVINLDLYQNIFPKKIKDNKQKKINYLFTS
jgi:hypothetical protein